MTVTELLSSSAEETRKLGQTIGQHAKPGWVLLLAGSLGVGKTVFAGGVAEALGIEGPITSPTFTIVSEYVGTASHCAGLPVFHIDLYRIADQNEYELLGLEEVIGGAAVSLIEWPDRAGDALPDEAYQIDFELLTDGTRKIRYPMHLVAE